MHRAYAEGRRLQPAASILELRSSRAEATLRTDLALALTAAGEHDEAEAQARRARELIDLLGSVRLRRRLRRLSA